MIDSAPETWRDRLSDLAPIWAHKAWSFARYDIHQGIYGLWYWAPFAWRWRTWDYGHGLEALRLHLRKLEVACREGHLVSGPRHAKQIRIALELLRRILDDGHGSYWERLQRGEITFKQLSQLEKRDWDMFWNICRREMSGWWD